MEHWVVPLSIATSDLLLFILVASSIHFSPDLLWFVILIAYNFVFQRTQINGHEGDMIYWMYDGIEFVLNQIAIWTLLLLIVQSRFKIKMVSLSSLPLPPPISPTLVWVSVFWILLYLSYHSPTFAEWRVNHISAETQHGVVLFYCVAQLVWFLINSTLLYLDVARYTKTREQLTLENCLPSLEEGVVEEEDRKTLMGWKPTTIVTNHTSAQQQQRGCILAACQTVWRGLLFVILTVFMVIYIVRFSAPSDAWFLVYLQGTSYVLLNIILLLMYGLDHRKPIGICVCC